MKILVTGANGMLGHEVCKSVEERGHTLLATDVDTLDVSDVFAIDEFFEANKPDAIIHCAAWTNVDSAEEPDNEAGVYLVNALGTDCLALVCQKFDCKMIYVSTDYVFSGEGTTPWDPDLSSPAPLNMYGQSKLRGEEAVKKYLSKYYIVRTSWLYGHYGKNFVETMLSSAEKYPSLWVVNDQIGNPTNAEDLAPLLVLMAEDEKYGIYHASNEGDFISWYDFAKAIFEISGKNIEVIGVSTEEYGRSAAKRPKNSRLDKSKLALNGFPLLPHWKQSLEKYLKQREN